MSSLHDHVANNRATGDAQKEAETALLNAITRAVAEVEATNWDIDDRGPRLKAIAQVYALVVHNND